MAVTGTGPTLAALANGDDILAAITWGSGYATDSGTLQPVSRQIRRSGQKWRELTATETAVGGQGVLIRELVFDENYVGQSFTTDLVTVSASAVENVFAPVLTTSGYSGGWVDIVDGAWSGEATLTQTMQVSANGVDGWADDATAIETDAIGRRSLRAGLAGQYVRIVEDAVEAASPAVSNVVGPLGADIDHTVSTLLNQNRLLHTVTPPLAGATIEGGLWMAAMVFFDGLTWGGTVVSHGNPAGTSYDIRLGTDQALGVASSGSFGTAAMSAPPETGWYLVAMYLRSPSTTRTITFWRNGETAEATVTGGTYTLSNSNWQALSIGTRVGALTTQTNVPIDGVWIGAGDPRAALEWAYNDGKLRQLNDYDWGTDPNGATLAHHIVMHRSGAATFDPAQIVDSIGGLDSWTHDAPLGAFTWIDRKPSFVVPWGNILAVPTAYLSPKFATTEDTLSIETGRWGRRASALPWASGTVYGVGARVTNGGETYRCLATHTSSALFSTDLSAGRWEVFTITVNNLTHSVLGDITGSVNADWEFTCDTPGTITGSVTVSGEAVDISCEVRQAELMPAAPMFATAFGGNGLAGGIEPYVSPVGAGATFATIAELNAAIGAMPAGSTLIVENLDDLAGSVSLQPPTRDYGGATVICRNYSGVKCARIQFGNVSNLTLVGFAVRGAIAGSPQANVAVEHCRAANFDLSGSETVSTFTFRNHMCWEEAVDGLPSAYTRFSRLRRVNGIRWVMAGMDNAVATFQMYRVGTFVFDRWYASAGSYYGAVHPDIFQLTEDTVQGYFDGDVRNGVAIHRRATPEEYGFQGIFLTDNAARDLRISNVVTDVSLTQSLSISGARQNVRIEDTFGRNLVAITSGYTDAAYASNVIRGSEGPVLTAPARGYETGTISLIDLGLAPVDVFPQYTLYDGTWRAFANPAAGYETAGPASFIAELEAKRIELGL